MNTNNTKLPARRVRVRNLVTVCKERGQYHTLLAYLYNKHLSNTEKDELLICTRIAKES